MECGSSTEKLGIKKKNINPCINLKQNISKKHLPISENIFGIDVLIIFIKN